MKRKILYYWIIGVIILFTGCNYVSRPTLSGVDIQIDEMNIDLTLDAPPELSEFIIGKDLGIVLTNNSKIPITLPPDYGIHIYQLIDNVWEPIGNWMDYGSEDKVIYPKDRGFFNEEIIAILPKAKSNDKPITLRVVIIGNYSVENGNVGDEVGAYVDIILQPQY